MSGSNWFGNLQLAYKYVVVFVGLLLLTLAAGFVKLFFDRRSLKKKAKQEEVEAGPKEDQVELNQREKDEGDLFGIRAIEAGFYAGVHQSRPTSRATSIVDHPAMSSSTLVGGVNSPLMKNHSANGSVNSFTLSPEGPSSPQSRKSAPSMKLRPSEAELTGRHGAVDMCLHVPPSPGLARTTPTSPSSAALEGDSSEAFTNTNRRSMSPRSADFDPQQYAPAPKIPMPDALQVTYHNNDRYRADYQTASYDRSVPGHSPNVKLPTIPASAIGKESRSSSPDSNDGRARREHSGR